MKVLFLVPPSMEGSAIVRDNLYSCVTKSKAKYLWPPIALAQFASIVRAAGLKPSILDCMAERLDFRSALERTKRIRPDYLVIIASSATYSTDTLFLKLVKERIPTTTIISGNFTTLFPEKALESTAVDFVTIGEPDLIIRDLIVQHIKDKDNMGIVRGIGFKKDEKAVITEKSGQIEDLDSLPFPARDLLPDGYFNPFALRLPFTTIMSSRGCPYQCTFCAAGQTYGKRFRARTPESMVKEIKECIKRYGIREILFRDETFTLDKKRVIKFCGLLKKEDIKVSWICSSRINTIDREMILAMKQAGCHMIKFGVESGSQKVLDMIKKGITVKQTRQVFKWMNELSVDSAAHFVLGCPGETEATIKQTMRFVMEIDPTYASFNIATPYPGTEMHNQVKDKLGGIDIKDFDAEQGLVSGGDYTKLLCGLPRKKIEFYYDKIHREFHFRPRYIIKRILNIKSPSQLYRQVIAGMSFFSFAFFRKKRP